MTSRFDQYKKLGSIFFFGHEESIDETELFGVALVIVHGSVECGFQVTDIDDSKAMEAMSIGMSMVQVKETVEQIVGHHAVCGGRDKEDWLGDHIALGFKEFDHEFMHNANLVQSVWILTALIAILSSPLP